MHEPVRLVARGGGVGANKRFISAYCTKLCEKQCSYLLIMYMENITESQDRCKFL